MRPPSFLLPIAILLSSAAVRAAQEATPAPGEPPSRAPLAVERASSEIEVDGALEEPAWAGALAVSLDYEWQPGDNVPPPVATEALVTYDDERLYVAFRCADPRPQQIRAHLMDRDLIDTFIQDDHVVLMIDTFDDERRGYQFRVNPLGVQADAIFSENEGVEDFAFDLIWESAGRITEEGYIVELAIPLNQIRFPRTQGGPMVWGFDLGRSYPRSVRHRISAHRQERDVACVLCEILKVEGFAGLEPGRNLEVDPTLTAARTDRRNEFPEGELEAGDEEVEPGITARWGITPNLSLLGTLNPDFSQVEADAAQLDVNERFALFFPEKRPFFLEGVDFFTTPVNAVFTRTVVDPRWGAKLTGKEGGNAFGFFLAEDDVTSFLIPSNQGTASVLLEEELRDGVLRYRRDIGQRSTIGVLASGRQGDEYRNTVAGLDAFFRLGPSDQLAAQVLRSETEYPEAVAADFGQPFGAFTGDAIDVAYDHLGRNWLWFANYESYEPRFRADSGFVPRVDIRRANGTLRRRFWGGEDDWWNRGDLALFVERVEDHDGQLTDEVVDLSANVAGPLQSFVEIALERDKIFFDGVLHEDLVSAQLFGEFQPSGVLRADLFADVGDTVDFANNRSAEQVLLDPGIEAKLGRRVNLRLDHTLQRLEVEGDELFEVNLSQLRLVYNFSVRAFVRAILQYQDLERNPALFALPVEPEVEELFGQLLFSYKLNPQTVLFAGTTEGRLGLADVSLTRTERTYFLKIGYAWVS